MNDLVSVSAITPLRQRLIDDMEVRRFSRETQRNYIREPPRVSRRLFCLSYAAIGMGSCIA